MVHNYHFTMHIVTALDNLVHNMNFNVGKYSANR